MLIALKSIRPSIHRSAYIAPTAVLIGDVTLGEDASVWFGAVLRGDTGRIAVGARTSVQDNVVLHVNDEEDTLIGNDVTIGHGAILEGCQVGDGVLIGMNATILSGAKIGAGSLIAAGAVVGENKVIPEGVLVAGVPARVIRPLSPELQARLAEAPQAYVANGRLYRQASEIIQP